MPQKRKVTFFVKNLNTAITSKWYEIGCRLVLITNRKSHMGFRLVPKSVTLNDLERCNSPYFAYFTEFDRLEGRLRHSPWLKIDAVFWLKLTHAAVACYLFAELLVWLF